MSGPTRMSDEEKPRIVEAVGSTKKMPITKERLITVLREYLRDQENLYETAIHSHDADVIGVDGEIDLGELADTIIAAISR